MSKFVGFQTGRRAPVQGKMRSFIRSRRMCEWDDFSDREAFARGRLVDATGAALLPPFLLLAEPGFTSAEQRACSEAWMRQRLVTASAEREKLDFSFSPPRRREDRGRKIRIGYLSNDFHDHATALLLIETLEAHDHSRFEVSAYSYGADDGGAMRPRLLRAFDRFVDICLLSDFEAAQAIHDDAIDILIDLKGFTQNSRTSILALRPAPVQVNFLGYPGTLGPGLCDYILTDGFVTPAHAAKDFSESFAYLPHSYQPNGRDDGVGAPPSRSAAGLPESGFIFCCFNQAFKFSPGDFDIWCRLLRETPHSVLWLLASREAEGNLRNEALSRGVDPGRLVFAPHMAQHDHLDRLQLADLVLDTSPYGAHTTASDALSVGVPLVTRPGATFSSRVAGSLLLAVGLPELIVEDEADYFNLAFALASDPARLAALREKLMRNSKPRPCSTRRPIRWPWNPSTARCGNAFEAARSSRRAEFHASSLTIAREWACPPNVQWRFHRARVKIRDKQPRGNTMVRKIIIAAASAAVLALSPAAFAQQPEKVASGAEAKEMLQNAVAAVALDDQKAIDMFNRGEGGFLYATAIMCFAPMSGMGNSSPRATQRQKLARPGRKKPEGCGRQGVWSGNLRCRPEAGR